MSIRYCLNLKLLCYRIKKIRTQVISKDFS